MVACVRGITAGGGIPMYANNGNPANLRFQLYFNNRKTARAGCTDIDFIKWKSAENG